MARIRTIKPEAPQSENLGRVSRDARLLFFMLFTIVDDAGRTRAAPRMLASLLFPFDDDAKTHIVEWLFDLERADCIVLYEVDGTAYLEIKKWLQHQKIDKPSPSRLPAPSESIRVNSPKPREASRTLDPYLVPVPVPVSRTKDQDQEAPATAVVVVSKPVLPDWLDPEAWAAFLDMRKRKRAPATPRAITLLIEKLDRWRLKGHDPTAILDASTTSAWTDLYEPKADRHGNHRNKPTALDTFTAAASDFYHDFPEGEGGDDRGSADQAGRPLLSS